MKIKFDTECIIYKVTNLSNGKIYIGKTIKSLECRKIEHVCSSKKQTDNSVFHKAIRKYGINSFKWEIVYCCNNYLLSNLMETFKIIVNHSHINENGYNMTWGGEGTYGYKFSNNQLKKLSESHIGKIQTIESKEKRSFNMKGKNKRFGNKNNRYGLYHTQETKKKMSKSHKGIGLGKKLSEETKQKISNGNKKYSDNIISKILKDITTGKSINSISKLNNIPYGTIYSWYKNQRGY